MLQYAPYNSPSSFSHSHHSVRKSFVAFIHNFAVQKPGRQTKRTMCNRAEFRQAGWREGGREGVMETDCEFRKRSSTWSDGLLHPREAHLAQHERREWIGGHAVFPVVYVENGRARGSSVTQRGRCV